MKRNRTTKFLLLLLSLCLLAGCGTSTREIDLQAVAAAAQETSEPTEDPRPFLDEFIALLNANDFGSCYAMLAPGTQEAVTLVDFSERYENIFSAIELTKLSVEYGSLTMDAGQRYAGGDAPLRQPDPGHLCAGRFLRFGLLGRDGDLCPQLDAGHDL